MKLGKLAPKANSKTLDFAKYLTGGLPDPAEKVYREYKTPEAAKSFFGNDTVGDCTFAGAANGIILMTCHTGTVVIPTLAQVLGGYSAVTGYDPSKTDSNGNNPTDNGAAMTDVLAYLQSTGLAGHKILGWAQIDHTNLVHRKIAVDLFGFTYVGVNLPSKAQDQFSAGQPWEVVPGDSIEGGHCILHPGYGSEGDDYVTWARWDQKASAEWSRTYIDEEYVIVSDLWINQATQKTPGGIDLPTLQADLKLLAAS